jgi:hypothetical protein
MKEILDNLPLVFSIFSKNSLKIVKEECEEWPRFSFNMCTLGYSDLDSFEKIKSLNLETGAK